MTAPRTDKRHDWAFVSATQPGAAPAGGGVAVLVAVCRRCGLIRTQPAAAEREGRIDLTGVCEPNAN